MDDLSKKHIARSALGKFGIVLGLLCLITAGALGFGMQTVRVSPVRGTESYSEAPNITAGAAACGFAIAGGLCFVAAAIAELRGREMGGSDDNSQATNSHS
jgi:hypothetical protein